MKQLLQLVGYALIFVALFCAAFALTLATAAEVPTVALVGGIFAALGLFTIFWYKE